MNGILRDSRHAVRLSLQTPVASIVTIAILATGIGIFVAFLSLYVDLAHRAHPGFEGSRRVVTIGQSLGDELLGLPYGIVDRVSADIGSIEASAMSIGTSTLIDEDREEVITEMVSEAFFDTLRPRVTIGRGLRIADHTRDAEPVAVISYRLWRDRFGGDSSILGTTLSISRDPRRGYGGPPGQLFGAAPDEETTQFRIVGVMSDAVPGLVSENSDLWVPLELAFPLFVGVPERLPTAVGPAYARMRSGASVELIAREINALFPPDTVLAGLPPGGRLDAIGGIVRNISVQRESERRLSLFLAGSVLLAFVASVNVGLHVLARAPSRQREFGVRIVVGAPIRRVLRQLTTEAALMIVVSSSLGLMLSVWLGSMLSTSALLRETEWHHITLFDWRVAIVTIVLLLILMMVIALAPLVGVKRLGIARASQLMLARISYAQRWAGTVQIAAAGALGGAAVAFAWYLSVLTFGDHGYEVDGRYLIEGAGDRLSGNVAAYVEVDRRRAAIEGIPGLTAVGFGSPVPGEEAGVLVPITIPDPRGSSSPVEVYTGIADDEFYDVLGLRLVQGRTPDDGESGVVIVNQALARAVWGRTDVVGERMPGSTLWGTAGADVIGVLEDVSFEHPSAEVKPMAFSSLASPGRRAAVVSTELSAGELQQALDALVASGALEVPIRTVRSLSDMRDELIANDRAVGFMTIAASALVVLFAAIGLYATQRYLVAMCKREHAIRAAVGAGPTAIGRLAMSRGLSLGLPGTVAGGLLAFIVVTWLQDRFLSDNVEPIVIAMAVIGALLSVIIAATWAPAKTARSTQPAILLRDG